MEEKHQEQGICPICGSDAIDYEAMEDADNSVYFPAMCCKCHAMWNEYYNLTFSGHYDIRREV